MDVGGGGRGWSSCVSLSVSGLVCILTTHPRTTPANQVGIASFKTEFGEDVAQAELLAKVQELNNDPNVHGALVFGLVAVAWWLPVFESGWGMLTTHRPTNQSTTPTNPNPNPNPKPTPRRHPGAAAPPEAHPRANGAGRDPPRQGRGRPPPAQPRAARAHQVRT